MTAVPRDLPMLNFWSVVLYDNDTRGMIVNLQNKTEVNSRQAIVKNKEGSGQRGLQAIRLIIRGKPLKIALSEALEGAFKAENTV